MDWSFNFTHSTEWSARPSLQLGPPSLGTPWCYLLVERDGKPWLRVCLELEQADYPAFEECLEWQSALWVGFGNRVFRIGLAELDTREYRLDSYFGSFYPLDHSLLICSACRLYHLDALGNVLWTSPEIGLDGVLVSEVSQFVIEGQGEWDPPGGWLNFRVDLNSGHLLT